MNTTTKLDPRIGQLNNGDYYAYVNGYGMPETRGTLETVQIALANADKRVPAMLDHECTKRVETLKGEFVKRKPDAKKVYRVIGYDRGMRRWQLDDCDDTNRALYVKKGTMLFAGFSY